MAKDPVLPLYYNDLTSSTQDWTDEEFGAFVRLLIYQWDKGALPSCVEELKKISPSLISTFSHIEKVLSKINGRYMYEPLFSISRNMFSECFVYSIILYDKFEKFVKIGIAFSLHKRYSDYKCIGYEIEEIETEFFGTRIEAIERENELHMMFGHLSYVPKRKFGGYTECFNLSIIENMEVKNG